MSHVLQVHATCTMTVAETIQVEEGTCCICLASLETPGLKCQALQCGHVIHKHCINTMRNHSRSGRCPLCRAELDELTPKQRLTPIQLLHVANEQVLHERARMEDHYA